MKKMSAPAMEVVRFTENDVIVASGYNGPTLTVYNFKNNTPGDVYVKYDTNPNEYRTAETLNVLLSAEGTNGKIGSYTVNDLFSSDGFDDGNPMAQALLPDMNGTYIWDSTTHSWHQ